MKKQEVKQNQENPNVKDVKEFTEMYSKLRSEDRLRVQGILMGLQMRDDQKAVANA